jgi:hypothetical protein
MQQASTVSELLLASGDFVVIGHDLTADALLALPSDAGQGAAWLRASASVPFTPKNSWTGFPGTGDDCAFNERSCHQSVSKSQPPPQKSNK